jgi:hypothetical protein
LLEELKTLGKISIPKQALSLERKALFIDSIVLQSLLDKVESKIYSSQVDVGFDNLNDMIRVSTIQGKCI